MRGVTGGHLPACGSAAYCLGLLHCCLDHPQVWAAQGMAAAAWQLAGALAGLGLQAETSSGPLPGDALPVPAHVRAQDCRWSWLQGDLDQLVTEICLLFSHVVTTHSMQHRHASSSMLQHDALSAIRGRA